MVPGLLERERLVAESRRREMLAEAAREHRLDDLLTERGRSTAPGWRWSLGGLLVRLGSRVQGANWTAEPAIEPAPSR